jgi:hypothetical protein
MRIYEIAGALSTRELCFIKSYEHRQAPLRNYCSCSRRSSLWAHSPCGSCSLCKRTAQTAQRVVMWYSARQWTLWVLLITLPFAVLVTGFVTLARNWRDDLELALARIFRPTKGNSPSCCRQANGNTFHLVGVSPLLKRGAHRQLGTVRSDKTGLQTCSGTACYFGPCGAACAETWDGSNAEIFIPNTQGQERNCGCGKCAIPIRLLSRRSLFTCLRLR